MRISVKVKLHRQTAKVVKKNATEYEVHSHALPEDSKANEDIINQLADHFKISKARIRIVSGGASKEKIVEII